MVERHELMQADVGERFMIEVRLLGQPCLWCWEIVDERARRVVESSWETEWTGYASSGEAWVGGFARLQRVTRGGRGVDGPDRPLPPKTRHLIIVARNAADRYKSLKGTFGDSRTIEMILDRRYAERRQRNDQAPLERRRADRRGRPDVDAQIRGSGWSIVRAFGSQEVSRPNDGKSAALDVSGDS